jgi:hypothetical protein
MGSIGYTFRPSGDIDKEAYIHTTLIDVFYIHRFYGIPLEDIHYTPVFKRSQRFLN